MDEAYSIESGLSWVFRALVDLFSDANRAKMGKIKVSWGWGWLNLDKLGGVIYGLLAIIVGGRAWKMKGKVDWRELAILIFILAEGMFLFKTGMLERYFFPAFPAAVVMFVLLKGRIRYWLGLQFLVWFVNLWYAFFRRDISWVSYWFQEIGGGLVRWLSLLNLIIFFLIVREVWNFERGWWKGEVKKSGGER